MRKYFCGVFSLATLLALTPSYLHAETWSLDGQNYEMTVVKEEKLADGVMHKMLKLSGATQLEVQVVELDMTNENVDFYTTHARAPKTVVDANGQEVENVKYIKVDQDRQHCSTLSQQMEFVKEAGKTPVVGVNGDFFAAAYHCLGNQYSDGNIVRCDASTYPVWYMTTDRLFEMGNYPLVATAKVTYSAYDNKVAEYPVSSINYERAANYLTIFTPQPGRTTGTNKWGGECLAELIEGEVGMTGSCKFRVVEPCDMHDGGNSSLDKYYAITGHGMGEQFLYGMNNRQEVAGAPKVVAGDIIEVTFSSTIPDSNIKEMIGGNPEILRDGAVLDTQNALNHLVNLEPRTSVGYTSDYSKAYLVVVDGRRPGESEGCTSRQLASIMKNVGAENALNLDGGGSTTMLDARTNTLFNKPTDGFAQGVMNQQRAVKNALWVVTNSNTGVEEAVIDADAPVVYFNLMGAKVANPTTGVYVRTQGTKVEKVIIK